MPERLHFVEKRPPGVEAGEGRVDSGLAAPAGPPAVAQRPSATPAVVLLHGQPGRIEHWRRVVEILAGRYRVIVVDRPGYGGTALPATDLAGNAEALAPLLHELQATPAVLVGHSFGGGVALVTALDHPGSVAALVLVGSIGGRARMGPGDRLLAVPFLGDAATAIGLPLLARAIPAVRHSLGHLPHGVAERLATALPDAEMVSELDPPRRLWHSVVVEQRAMAAELPGLSRRLAQIAVPTAVLAGAWDRAVPLGAQRDLAEGIAGAALCEVPRAGHFIPRDSPALVGKAVDRVVKQVQQVTAARRAEDQVPPR